MTVSIIAVHDEDLTFTLYRNGVSTGNSATITAGNILANAGVADVEYSQGDNMSVAVDCPVIFTGTSLHMKCTLGVDWAGTL
jgi:hypothetical protein